MRRILATLTTAGVVLFAACEDATQPTVRDPATPQAAVQIVPNQYIVVFNDDVADPPGLAQRLANQHGVSLLFSYEHAVKGFAFRGASQAADVLSRNPNVAYVEPDREARLFATQNNPPSWGLDRVDQRDLPLDDSYTYNVDGTGVNVYILDTGVRISHNDFGGVSGRAAYIPNSTAGDFVGDGHGSAEDCHGHGTHVAGTSAGTSYGVAKGASIWAGRVVNCAGGGQVSMAIAGVDWITANGLQPAVVNMSLGYGDVQSLRDAVENSIAAGFNYSVAAGNGNFVGIPQDACRESPAGAPNANTVGATAIDDDEASFSNYGTCVDILAPGVSIESDYYLSDNSTATMSGTSMATPHVTGAIALYLDANPGASPPQVSQALVDNATRNAIRLHRRSRQNNTPNLLLYTAFIGGGGGNTPPTASFTSTCTDLTCDFDASSSSDSDGSIVSYDWDFGDGNAGSGVTVGHTYATGGTYTVTLTVTDDGGATGSDEQDVTVTSGGGGFTLSATGYKVKGVHTVDLTWSGATSANVDVYRDGSFVTTTANDGFHTDDTGNKGGNVTYVYQVCEQGSTTTCSNQATVNF